MSNQHQTDILFYGYLADLLGPKIELAVPEGCSVRELRERIATSAPTAAAEAVRSGRTRACIGDVVVAEDHVVEPGDKVEFFPPVSGG